MRWKQFSIIPALILVLTTTVAPMKLAAQGLVEYALILVVVGVGLDETAEIYMAPKPGRGDSEVPPIAPGDTATLTFVVTNPVNATCTQTIEKAFLEATLFGLPMLSVSKGFGFVAFADGDEVELQDECFKDPQHQRAIIQMGVKVPPEKVERLASDPKAFDAEFGIQLTRRFLGYSIRDSITGKTLATAALSPPVSTTITVR